MSDWYVYIIQTEKDRLYTGITTHIERRFVEHSSGSSKGAKFFRSDKPQKIVYGEACADRSEASTKEAAIKKLTRPQKEKFIEDSTNGGNNIYGTRKKESKYLAGSSGTSRKRK